MPSVEYFSINLGSKNPYLFHHNFLQDKILNLCRYEIFSQGEYKPIPLDFKSLEKCKNFIGFFEDIMAGLKKFKSNACTIYNPCVFA